MVAVVYTLTLPVAPILSAPAHAQTPVPVGVTNDIFLSCKRENEALAARLAKALEADRFSVW